MEGSGKGQGTQLLGQPQGHQPYSPRKPESRTEEGGGRLAYAGSLCGFLAAEPPLEPMTRTFQGLAQGQALPLTTATTLPLSLAFTCVHPIGASGIFHPLQS